MSGWIWRPRSEKTRVTDWLAGGDWSSRGAGQVVAAPRPFFLHWPLFSPIAPPWPASPSSVYSRTSTGTDTGGREASVDLLLLLRLGVLHVGSRKPRPRRTGLTACYLVTLGAHTMVVVCGRTLRVLLPCGVSDKGDHWVELVLLWPLG